MSHAHIPIIFWDEIFSSIVYLINRLSSHNNIPYKLLLGKKPDYTQLRILGCLCFPLTRPYNKHKLELRSKPCVFIGYGISQKGHHCLYISSNRIFVSRNVTFDEVTFSFKTPSQLVQPEQPVSQSNSQTLNLLEQQSPSLLSSNTVAQDVSRASPSTAPTHTQTSPFATDPTEAHQSHPLPAGPTEAQQPVNTLADGLLSDPLPYSSHFPFTESSSPPNTPLTASNPSPHQNSDAQPLNSHSMVTRAKDRTLRQRHFPNFVALHSTAELEPHVSLKQTNYLTSEQRWPLKLML